MNFELISWMRRWFGWRQPTRWRDRSIKFTSRESVRAVMPFGVSDVTLYFVPKREFGSNVVIMGGYVSDATIEGKIVKLSPTQRSEVIASVQEFLEFNGLSSTVSSDRRK